MAAFGLEGFWALGVFYGVVIREILFYAFAEFRRPLQNWQVIFLAFGQQCPHGCLRLCHGMHALKWHTPDLFACGVQILNCEARVKSGAALPQSTDCPLAAIQ